MSTFPRGHHHTAPTHNRTPLDVNRAVGTNTGTATPPVVHRRFEFPIPTDLRGIPAIGHGVNSTIRGTDPSAIR
jgi:hypothetical protein